MINFKKVIIFFLSIKFILFSWWLILIFNTFPKKFYFSESFSTKNNSAIIVLTGGKGRIQKGIDLYNKEHGKFLFISGVFRESEWEVKQMIDKQIQNQLCCVFYDKDATNTIENAYQVKNWLLNKSSEIDNLILVSSYYHLPRSYLIFKNIIDNKNIMLVPAKYKILINENIFFHIKLIILEFYKVIYTLLSL